MRQSQYKRIVEIMRTRPHDNWTTGEVNEYHHKLKGYGIQIGTRICYLVRAGYMTSVPIDKRIKHLYYGMENFYQLTDIGRNIDLSLVVITEEMQKSKSPDRLRSSQEESHIKKENKVLNELPPPPIQIDRFARLKNFLSFNKSK